MTLCRQESKASSQEKAQLWSGTSVCGNSEQVDVAYFCLINGGDC